MFLSLKIYVFKIQRQLFSRNTTMVAFEYASVSWYPENSPVEFSWLNFPWWIPAGKLPQVNPPWESPNFFFFLTYP